MVDVLWCWSKWSLQKTTIPSGKICPQSFHYCPGDFEFEKKRYPFNVWPFPGLLTNPTLAIFICYSKPKKVGHDLCKSKKGLKKWSRVCFQHFCVTFKRIYLNTWPLYGCIAWPDEVDTIRRRSGRRKKPKGFLNVLGVAVEILCVFTITILWLTLECRHILLQWLTFWELGPRSPRI